MLPTSDTSAYEVFRTNKCIPKILEKEILCALSCYPELKETPIFFVFKRKIRGSVMQAQPKFSTMLRGTRAYNINISAMFRLTHSAIPIQQIPSDVIVGWIGHELGHVMDYECRSTVSMIRFGLGYVFSRRFVREAERVADTFAVNHGLGNYILKTKHFILNHAALSDKYKRKIARLYLSPDDIVEQVRKLEATRVLPS
ncbi:hypothetical protein [Dyadobacter sandarakinus]|uniref:Peptidase M48 domain-containing protein n=1 Tax=Dyadobacter sandarakinus TaxID=2747268 RepID=A0ABX7I1Y8_9BACT|nr:hypothetical protein [Dyadobacter sandarakinus]QRR00092.1 hypothetical protein HWI92_03780 [Dyadobacter sandarakinus]